MSKPVVTLTDWSLWLQGTDERGNVRKFRIVKPKMLDSHATIAGDLDGNQINLENEEAV